MRRSLALLLAVTVSACIQPPQNEPRPLPDPRPLATEPRAPEPQPAAPRSTAEARDTTPAPVTVAAAPAQPAAVPAQPRDTTRRPAAAAPSEIEAEREAIRRELAMRRQRIDSLDRADSVAQLRVAAARREAAARAPARDTAPATVARATPAPAATQPATPAATRPAAAAAQTPARDTARRSAAAEPAPPPAQPAAAAPSEIETEREAIRRELALRRQRIDSLDRADSVAQLRVAAARREAAARASAQDTAPATVARATPAATRPATPAATRPAPATAGGAQAQRARAPATAAPRPDTRTPVELRLDSTNALVAGAMNISSEAMTQAQIATAERTQDRLMAAMESLQTAARQSEWHAHAAMVQGDMLGVLLTAPGQSSSMASEYERYWQLARAKLDTARIQAGLAAQHAENATKCEEQACARTHAGTVRQHMIAASGAAREADGLLRLAMRNVR